MDSSYRSSAGIMDQRAREAASIANQGVTANAGYETARQQALDQIMAQLASMGATL